MQGLGSLYDRIGGEYAINAVVDEFYVRVLGDDLLNPFFDGVCMDAQIVKMKTFLRMVFGGVESVKVKNMRSSHKHLVSRGLSDVHVDKVIFHLRSVLDENDVDPSIIVEVIEIVDSYRDEVLGR